MPDYSPLTLHEHVDLRKAAEIELWTDALDIYTADLFNAVAAVGTSSTAVLDFLLDRGVVGSRPRS